MSIRQNQLISFNKMATMALINVYRSRDYTSNGRSAFSSSIGEELLVYSLARSLSGLYSPPPGILCPNSNRNSLTERGENCIFRVSHNSDIKELSVQPCEQTSSPVSKSFHSLDCFSAQFGKTPTSLRHKTFSIFCAV